MKCLFHTPQKTAACAPSTANPIQNTVGQRRWRGVQPGVAMRPDQRARAPVRAPSSIKLQKAFVRPS